MTMTSEPQGAPATAAASQTSGPGATMVVGMSPPGTVTLNQATIEQAIATVLSQPLTAKNLTADAKSFLMSKTLWGIVMMAVATEAQQLGYHFTTGDQSDLVNDITAFFQLGGMVLATIGRITATKELK